MKIVSCYNCGSFSSGFYASENGFTLVKCMECGLLYVNPRPDDGEIAAAHKVGVHRGMEAFEVTGTFNYRKIKWYFKVLKEFFGNGMNLKEKTWLDVGCGHGEFLTALKDFSGGSVTVLGMEPNVHKQESARSRGLNVTCFDLDTHKGKYDVISSLNVYSHIPDPPAAILSWKRLLKPDGELFLETGDTADFDNKTHFKPFYLPDHLSFASEKIVVNILEKSGFEVISIKKYPFFRLEFVPFVKEVVKVFVPNHKSRIGSIVKRKAHAAADMFIKARLKR